MKIRRFSAFLLAIVMLFAMIPFSSAADVEIISTETVDLGDGLTGIITTAVISRPQSRSGEQTVTAQKRMTTRHGSTKIGEFAIYGTFTYNGSRAKAIEADWYAATASGFDYEGDAYCSGASVKGSCRFTGNGIDKTLEIKLTCDKDGNLS